jgi:Raf kinase inhibitor-like YbhB/YbcL family protein
MIRTLLLTLLVAVTGTAQAATFKLQAHAADANGHIKKQYVYNASGCDGDNVSPAIRWKHPPKNTRAFALTVYDPDAKGGWWHWVVLDIPQMTHDLKQGGPLPAGAFALKNSFGHERWDGPCPPKGDKPHHYVFTIYALDVAALGLAADASREDLKDTLATHTLGKAHVTYTYGR